MDLFKLLGTISIENSEANRALDETSKKGQNAESKLGKAFKSVGNGALAVGKAVGTGLMVAGTAVAGLVTNATSAYAQYEQLVGGVDTLFGKSSEKVQAYAEKAYETAGMSANEYMETVTSFSASLLQSLGGDTEKAADKADMAIRDMSDNANKMGTSMEMIQNAYQGFAKQNYTMLDNLKLGYGGTKEEMARLLADAQAISGIEYDISSYGDVVDAIHVIQTQMGITGTTASEAAGTISGSMASVKGAWTNLVTAMASDNLPLDEYITKFADSATTMVSNMMPRIQQALGGVVQLIDQLAPVILGKIPELVSQLLPSVIEAATGLINVAVSILPDLINTIVEMIPAFIGGVVQIINAIINALPQITQSLVSALPTLLPVLINGLMSMLMTLMGVIPQIIQPIIDALPDIIISIVDALLTNLPILIEGLINLCIALVAALPQIVQTLIDMTPTIVEMLVTSLLNCLPQLLAGIAQLVWGIMQALPTLLTANFQQAIGFIEGLWNGIMNVFAPFGEWFANLFTNVWNTMVSVFSSVGTWVYDNIIAPVVSFFTDLWNSIVNAYHTVIDPWIEIFKRLATIVNTQIIQPIKNFFVGLWNDIKAVFSVVGNWFKTNVTEPISRVFTAVWGKLKNGALNAWNGIKSVFSKVASFFGNIFSSAWEKVKAVFSVGGEIFDGIKEGIVTAFKTVVNAIITGINKVVKIPFEGLNKILDRIYGIEILGVSPFTWLTWRAPIPEIPMLAKGGIVDRPTLNIAGEAGAEAITPINALKQYIGEAVASQNAGLVNVLLQILDAILMMDKNMGGNMRDALGGISLDVNHREFARLVKEVI